MNWAFDAIGQSIGNGWNFADVFSGGDGVIYAIASTGDLFYYRDEARNGTFGWAFNGAGQRIGRGWNGFWTVFSGGGGIVYAITTSGDLLYYRDEARNGTFNWSFDGIGQRIGNGWIPALLEGYCWPLSAFPGGTIEFKVSSRILLPGIISPAQDPAEWRSRHSREQYDEFRSRRSKHEP